VSSERLASMLLVASLFVAPILGGRLPLDPSLDSGALPAVVEQLIVAIPVLLAAILVAFRANVSMLPAPKVLLPLVWFWLFIFVSAIASEFRHEAMMELCRWSIYLIACGVCVSVLGRTTGPRFALTVWFAGCVVMACVGVWEYVQNVATTPNWRVFAGWQNPNAAAGMLSIAIPVGIGLGVTSTDRRSIGLPLSIGCGIVLVALWLTASKGGLASAGVGILVFAIANMLQRKSRVLLAGWPTILLCAISATAILVLIKAPAQSNEQSDSSRVFAAGAESEQSVGFRKRLWQDTITVISNNPLVGVGIGAFGVSFPRYATTQGSALAHNSYLQLTAEVGVVGLIALFAFVVFWLAATTKYNAGIPPSENLLRNAILGSAFAAGANAFVESSFSYFGFALSVFALFGIALLLAPDGARPERLPVVSRIAPTLLMTSFAFVYFSISAISDSKLAQASALVRAGEPEGALELLKSASSHPLDATPKISLARLLLARASALEQSGRAEEAKADREEARTLMESAVRLRPTATTLSLYADTLFANKMLPQARSEYGRAALLAPANPLYKRKLLSFYISIGDDGSASQVAEDLIAMEQSDFFKLRALPWLVNLDTLEARVYLADRARDESDIAKEIEMLEGAVQLLAEYRRKTFAELKRMTGGKTEYADFELGGQSLNIAQARFEELRSIAARLKSLYESQGREADARKIDDLIAELASI
jgi:O-antigen ligase